MDAPEKEEEIKTNAMVSLNINGDTWIGQVIEIKDQVCWVKLQENMHYHATMSELSLLTPKRGATDED